MPNGVLGADKELVAATRLKGSGSVYEEPFRVVDENVVRGKLYLFIGVDILQKNAYRGVFSGYFNKGTAYFEGASGSDILVVGLCVVVAHGIDVNVGVRRADKLSSGRPEFFPEFVGRFNVEFKLVQFRVPLAVLAEFPNHLER